MTVVENFAAEEMNILNPKINSRGADDGIFRMEFPLMQWIIAWFYKWMGADITVARILSFITAAGSISGFYQLLRTWKFEKPMAAICAWCFSWSPVLFYYAVNPLPDNLALCFAIWSLVYLKKHQRNSKYISLLTFAGLLSIATAVKLPFIVFGAGYIPLFFNSLKKSTYRESSLKLCAIALLMAPALAWYAWVIPEWTNTALIGGIGAEQSFDYWSALFTIWGTLHSLLPELFVNYGSVLFLLFGIAAFIKTEQKWKQFQVELSILLFVFLYYLYEVNMIGLVHDYYLFPFVPFIFLIVAAGVKAVLMHRTKAVAYLGLFALVILPLTCYLRTVNRWQPMGFEKELLTHKKELNELIPDTALVVVGNDPSTHIMLYHLGNKGWTFERDWLIEEILTSHINQGAQFLVVNTEHIEASPGLKRHTGAPIFRKDGITVYPLKPIIGSL